jgi:hypothetical protein
MGCWSRSATEAAGARRSEQPGCASSTERGALEHPEGLAPAQRRGDLVGMGACSTWPTARTRSY